MILYPALRARLGTWTYYSVKMSARELSETVKFAHEIYEDRTLDQAIQRVLNEGRVKKEIVSYLKRQEDRFFSSIVVAALNGDPKFYPVRIADDPQFAILSDDNRLNESFGVLKFDGTQQYYALDGQHRLAAIKTLLDANNPRADGAPEDFAKDEFSVIIVVPNRGETREVFLQKYRRLFSNLNRYAKPTDQTTNIIMDEDDAFAILTRRLITEHHFFKSAGRQAESVRVKTDPGKNLRTGESYFTSLETLYEMNKNLLRARWRENTGWGPNGGEKEKEFTRFRPPEEYLNALFDELVMYWDALLREIPDLHREPSKMRTHNLEGSNPAEYDDNLLFWPIGQELLTEVARAAIDRRAQDPRQPKPEDIQRAIKGLGRVSWSLHKIPWRHFLLIEDAERRGQWKMRSEDRTEAVRVGRRIVQWLIGLDALDDEALKLLKEAWLSRLIPAQPEEAQEQAWRALLAEKVSRSTISLDTDLRYKE